MRNYVISIIAALGCHSAIATSDAAVVSHLARNNGYKPSQRVIEAIVESGHLYHINVRELAAIAIIETGIGTNVQPHTNADGSVDEGLFQINTVNKPKCIEYNLSSYEGSAMCAAKLLNMLKRRRNDYLGVYHSKTKAKKTVYMQKLAVILAER